VYIHLQVPKLYTFLTSQSHIHAACLTSALLQPYMLFPRRTVCQTVFLIRIHNALLPSLHFLPIPLTLFHIKHLSFNTCSHQISSKSILQSLIWSSQIKGLTLPPIYAFFYLHCGNTQQLKTVLCGGDSLAHDIKVQTLCWFLVRSDLFLFVNYVPEQESPLLYSLVHTF
jgi:hypothetical protein